MQVYNFCVAVDDALMEVTHVLRAEEHLPNTLRQMLVYEALGYAPPQFGHMSLILAPDKSKLSKRHGATSVGEFREQVRPCRPLHWKIFHLYCIRALVSELRTAYRRTANHCSIFLFEALPRKLLILQS